MEFLHLFRRLKRRWAIATFERQNRAMPPPHNAVLFVGSSSIRFWNLPRYFPNLDVINRGFGASHLADSVHFADRIILNHKPRAIVLYAGDNDLGAGKSPERIFSDFQEFDKTIHAALPATKILFISIKPCFFRLKLIDKVRRTNDLVKAYCQQDTRLVYIDVFQRMLGPDCKPRWELFIFDGLHLNAKGYALWTSILKPHLK